jgi:hypothetical protein
MTFRTTRRLPRALPRVCCALLLLPAALWAEGERQPLAGVAEPTPRGPIDEALFRRWRSLGIRPALRCADAVFLRRVSLDATGTLPSAEEARRFLEDPDPGKRAALVDRLLATEAFADYNALRWCDLLRVKAEFPINLWPNAAAAYHRWVRASLAENVPYDRFARELITASGSNFRVPQVNFYRALQSKEPEAIARVVALTFLGARAEQWPPERLRGLAAFFSRVGFKGTREWKEEIVFFDPTAEGAEGAPLPTEGCFPDGTRAALPPGADPRACFAAWLIRPENPWFARALVNRVWFWLLGRGIIHEPDDIRPENPPRNPELLVHLERSFVASGYDMRALYRAILTSEAYQLACVPRTPGPDAEAEFASYVPRRLEAEVLLDALCQISGTSEQYSSLIPEPFTIIPQGFRAVALPDGSITNAFLELFGRPPRDTGLVAERNIQISAAQCLHLLNSSHVRQKIEQGPALRTLMQRTRGKPRLLVTELYLAILSRFPTEEELRLVQARARAAGIDAKGPRRRGPEARGFADDLIWALLNSAEFLYRH